MIRVITFTLFCLAQAMPSFAMGPRVVTDIPPVASLVEAVMEGVGKPVLLLDGVASPHDATLRPSQAAELQAADIVIYVSDLLSPSITRQIVALSKNATKLELISLTKDRHLMIQGSSEVDPHAWLDVTSVQVWAKGILDLLINHDADNAIKYTANYQSLKTSLDALAVEVAENMSKLSSGPFVVYHDGLQYFGRVGDANGLPIVGYLLDSEASAPSARHLRNLGGGMTEKNVTCVLAEPGYDPDLVVAVSGKQEVQIASLDILARKLELSATTYVQMMRALMAQVADCS